MLGEFEYMAAAPLGEEAYGAATRREIEEATETRRGLPATDQTRIVQSRQA